MPGGFYAVAMIFLIIFRDYLDYVIAWVFWVVAKMLLGSSVIVRSVTTDPLPTLYDILVSKFGSFYINLWDFLPILLSNHR